MPPNGFDGLTVVAFESRMVQEMIQLIQRYGGNPLVAPSLKEIPLESNAEALHFGERLLAGTLDMVMLLTGVGTRILVDVLQTRWPLTAITNALSQVILVARGPKPVNALKGFGLSPHVTVPEPNTWRDILQTLDALHPNGLHGKTIAVQEYGMSNQDLINGLASRGAIVNPVPVYRWALPSDLSPLRHAIERIMNHEAHVALFTNAAQVDHVFQIAHERYDADRFGQALGRLVIASIGQITSERLREYGLSADLEPSHPKMGIFIKEASQQAHDILQRKREG